MDLVPFSNVATVLLRTGGLLSSPSSAVPRNPGALCGRAGEAELGLVGLRRPAAVKACRHHAISSPQRAGIAATVAVVTACGRHRQRRQLLRRCQGSSESKLQEPPAAAWHAARRRAVLAAHPEVAELCGPDWRTLPILIVANAAQLGLAAWSGLMLRDATDEPVALAGLVALALGVGGTLSLWSFAVLHDLIHGTCVRTDKASRESLLFWLSFPTIFGYHLYLQRGHLSHHRNLGRASMGQLFDSQRSEFEDGDVLFVAHRQPLAGRPFEVKLPLPGGGTLPTFSPSISYNMFTQLWDKGPAQPFASGSSASDWRGLRNAAAYSFSMLFERLALAVNDKIVALTGWNVFFLQKPEAFHKACATYARTAALLHAALFVLCGPGSLLYLLIAEVAWQLPHHPACAMFISNHGSGQRLDGRCAPTASLYIGQHWGVFDWVCMFSNYHLEHHDFPDIPLLKLPALTRLAPEFYGLRDSSAVPAELGVPAAAQDWLSAVQQTFASPQPYACSVVAGIDDGYAGEEDSAAWALGRGL